MRQVARNVAAPSVQDAFENVVESGHRLVLDRIDLLQLDITNSVNASVRMAGMHAGAGLFALGALIAFSVAAAQGLATWMPMAGAVAIVGGVHTLLAGVLFWAGNRQKAGQ